MKFTTSPWRPGEDAAQGHQISADIAADCSGEPFHHDGQIVYVGGSEGATENLAEKPSTTTEVNNAVGQFRNSN